MSGQSADEMLTELLIGVRGRPLDQVVLRSLIEEASEAGAVRALASLGLGDERARRDMDELRELLGTWRDVKRSAWQAVAAWIVRILLATLLIGMAMRLEVQKLVGA